MLLTTTTFFFSSLLPLLQPLYCSCHLYFCWCFVAEPRCGGESDVGAAALHHHSMLESSQSIGDPQCYHMSRTKPPTLRSEKMRSPSTLACIPRIFFSTFNRPLISTTCLEPPDTYGTKMMNRMNLRETSRIQRIDS
ncbi:hypothetical protein Bca4012_099410 [Brassica carinata]|uniref:Secreted protein n=1 Tax=Brassica carinata TaxID=52824 RepID=A0A8X7PIF3_BRACI|nr:hypothetical protein Bca52824_082036 [Brassica carinata]